MSSSFILVTGCPRSGTSAIAAWLGDHCAVDGYSETRILVAAHAFLREVQKFKALSSANEFLLQEIRATVCKWYGIELTDDSTPKNLGRSIVEKEPLEPIAFPRWDYDIFLESVRMLFPDCWFVLVIRHPLPTIWSMVSRKWGVSLNSGEVVKWKIEDCIEIWRRSARLIHRYRDDMHAYVLQFERLTMGPRIESRNVLNALGLTEGIVFNPRSTSKPLFSSHETEKILIETYPERQLFGYD